MNNAVSLIILFVMMYIVGILCDSTHYYQYLLCLPIKNRLVKVLLFGPYVRWDYTWDAVMIQALRCAWMLVAGGVFIYKKLGFTITDKSIWIIVLIATIVVLLIEFVPVIIRLIKAKHETSVSRNRRIKCRRRIGRGRRR